MHVQNRRGLGASTIKNRVQPRLRRRRARTNCTAFHVNLQKIAGRELALIEPTRRYQDALILPHAEVAARRRAPSPARSTIAQSRTARRSLLRMHPRAKWNPYRGPYV